LVPVLQCILSTSGDFLEYLENGLEILTYVTYHVDSSTSSDTDTAGDAGGAAAATKAASAAGMVPYVELLPLLAHAFQHWAYDYVEQMASPIDNMIGYATDQFLASVDPASGKSYLELTLGIAEKVFLNRQVFEKQFCSGTLVRHTEQFHFVFMCGTYFRSRVSPVFLGIVF
jgi:hypothetical protein